MGGGPGIIRGLSHAHTGTKHTQGEIRFYKGGSLLVVSKPKLAAVQVGGGRRGKISEFSRAARRRMLKMMAKTKRDVHPLMVTLTYPSEFPGSPADWTRHRKLFLKRLLYHWLQSGGVWKLEPQTRGAPHYHLLVWGITKTDYLKFLKWVSVTWYTVVGSGDQKHLRAGTRVEPIRNSRGVMAYAAKYVGKLSSAFDLPESLRIAWSNVGKWWGCFGLDNIPWATVLSAALPIRQVYKIMRLIRRAAHIPARQYQSLALFCCADFWFDRFDRLLE